MAGAPVYAGVTAERSRVIFPGDANEISLQVANLNGYPVMVQTWIDDGALDSTPDKAVAPIMPLPPVFRLLPAEHRTLRLVFTGEGLPADRESLYWLNFYEVPPSDAGNALPAEQARLVVTMRTQMKVFYRPKGLAELSERAVSLLSFSLVEAHGKQVLRVQNPTPYYVTLAALNVSGASADSAVEGGMVAPLSQLDLSLATNATLPLGAGHVRFIWIDDDGNAQKTDSPLH